MKYFVDTEFIERGPDYPIALLSIGIAAEDGREFYAEASWTDRSLASPWVQEHVIPHLDPEALFLSRDSMGMALQAFCDPEEHGKPEFWAYYADYDWVVLCQIFGTMMELPKGFPLYCRDIKQEADRLEAAWRTLPGYESYKLRLPEQGKGEHHALADARWNRVAWMFLDEMQQRLLLRISPRRLMHLDTI